MIEFRTISFIRVRGVGYPTRNDERYVFLFFVFFFTRNRNGDTEMIDDDSNLQVKILETS